MPHRPRLTLAYQIDHAHYLSFNSLVMKTVTNHDWLQTTYIFELLLELLKFVFQIKSSLHFLISSCVLCVFSSVNSGTIATIAPGDFLAIWCGDGQLTSLGDLNLLVFGGIKDLEHILR